MAETTSEVKWTHSSDGTLVPDRPFEVVGTKLEVVVADPDWGEKYVGSTGVIDDWAANYNAKRSKQYTEDGTTAVYAYWTTADGRELGQDSFRRDCIKVVYDN